MLQWDTYRTLFPLMTMHDPYTMAKVVRGMIDIQKHEGKAFSMCDESTSLLMLATQAGFLNVVAQPLSSIFRVEAVRILGPGLAQRYMTEPTADADPILAEFLVKYMWRSSVHGASANHSFCRLQDHVAELNVSADDLYTALLADAEEQPPNWNVQGREANAWKEYSGFCFPVLADCPPERLSHVFLSDYIPQFFFNPGGANTKWVSRTLEVHPYFLLSGGRGAEIRLVCL